MEPPTADENHAPWEQAFKRVLLPVQHFLHHQTTASGLLMICTALALLIANSSLYTSYQQLLDTELGLRWGGTGFTMSLLHWINEALMALFFLLVGLELKRELLVGELADLRRASLPIAAAIGGMLVPAAIYAAINPTPPAAHGWGVPMATDIAFAVGALALLGKRIPVACTSFLVALAIADDLGAVLVIALFYTDALNMHALIACLGFCAGLVALNLGGVRSMLPYLLVGVLLWAAMLSSGVHATIAGVLLAFFIPITPKFNVGFFIRRVRDIAKDMEADARTQPDVVVNEALRARLYALDEGVSLAQAPAQRLEHKLHLPVAFLILPLFALANACVPLAPDSLRELFSHSVTIGVVAGLVLGKWLGVVLACWLAIKCRLAQLPEQMSMRHIHGLGLLAGIGFTMSIFVADLAFSRAPELLLHAKTGILLASITAGLAGYCWLRFACPPPRPQ